MAAPGTNPPAEFLQLDGHGVSVRYRQNQLEVTWESGAQLTMRSPERRMTAQVDLIQLLGTVVLLTLKAAIPVPEPWFSHADIVLAFPGALEEDVRRLGARLNDDQPGTGAPTAREPDRASPPPPAQHRRDPWDPPAAEPAPPPPQNGHPPTAVARGGHPAELPPVAFAADMTAWADDPDWIGLFPPAETSRLIVGRSPGRSREADSLPSV